MGLGQGSSRNLELGIESMDLDPYVRIHASGSMRQDPWIWVNASRSIASETMDLDLCVSGTMDQNLGLWI